MKKIKQLLKTRSQFMAAIAVEVPESLTTKIAKEEFTKGLAEINAKLIFYMGVELGLPMPSIAVTNDQDEEAFRDWLDDNAEEYPHEDE